MTTNTLSLMTSNGTSNGRQNWRNQSGAPAGDGGTLTNSDLIHRIGQPSVGEPLKL